MEILSPAGSFEALCAAVNYGADAVYVGGTRFSARRGAQNFSDEELARAVDFCHVRDAKMYVCCNTLMKETELSQAMDFIHYLYAIGVDALIIQDLGLLSRVRQELPDMPVHASTQMTITNTDGVNLLSDLGVKRVVLAREVTKQELESICKNTKTEIEYFVHGALCISYSGQCLMSSLLGGRSGNRGGCAQPCRLPYTLLKDGQPVSPKQALLCPKDLCLADRVQELRTLGVTSLKIEGRMKSPEYVAMVTQVYKKAATTGITNEEIQEMLKFFSRGGSCYGYFDGCRYGEMMDPIGNTKIAPALPLLEKQKKQVPVFLSLVAETGKALTLSMTAEDGKKVTVSGEVCEEARVHVTEKERMEEQLKKLGETPFYAKEIEIFASDNVAVPVKMLNALRRQAADELEALIVNSYKRKPVRTELEPQTNGIHGKQVTLRAEVMNEEQLRVAVACGISCVYLPEKLWHLAHLVEEPILQLSPLNKEGQNAMACDAAKVCIQNLGQLSAVLGKDVVAGHRLNATNSETINQLKRLGMNRVVLSPELNIKAIRALSRHAALLLEVVGYGRLPLMLLNNCVIKSNGLCREGSGCPEGDFALLDRKNERFPLFPTQCGNAIYNAKPIYMADRMHEVIALGIDSVRLVFTDEDGETCRNVIQQYQAALAGKTVCAPQGEFTRGHFYRGMQ